MSQIIPAILTDSLTMAEQQLAQAAKFAQEVQVDFMDTKFVPDYSLQIVDLQAIKIPKKLTLEAHLMVEHPEEYFQGLMELGFAAVIFHFEAADPFELEEYASYARKVGFKKVGLAINPPTTIDQINKSLKFFESLLFLGVIPGKQGQAFQGEVAEKMKIFHSTHPAYEFAIDGGVRQENIKEVAATGVNRIIIGSGIWEAESPEEAYNKFLKEIQDES